MQIRGWQHIFEWDKLQLLQIQKLEEEKQILLIAMTLLIKETTPKSGSQGIQINCKSTSWQNEQKENKTIWKFPIVWI